jgi:NAD(P)-dependent dehydrogenase (short-subunit alcohol dehydrogenase family)
MSTATSTRIALVSGGTRGIGKAIGLALAADGCDVAVNYRRDVESAAQTVAEIEALGRRALAVQASVDDFDAVRKIVDEVVATLGRPTILVHAAGIASRGNSVVDTEPDELARVVGMHAFGGFNLAKLCIPHMRGSGRGDIVMISSVASIVRAARSAPYTMAKLAMEGLASVLANELQADSIRVNVVAPGLVATEMGDRLAKAMSGGRVSTAAELDSASPFGRVCRPEDVAQVVRFLVSPLGSYVSNGWIRLDGGGRQ